MNLDLFGSADTLGSRRQALAPGALLLRGFATAFAPALMECVQQVIAQAPLRRMLTPGGLRMAVAMSNCGPLGWVSDARGYRYDSVDPQSGFPWPPMPALFARVASDAAAQTGYADFAPDACLINRYEPGTRLSLHQDKDERDFGAPIVSVSLGLPAVFLFGGLKRADPAQRIALRHGDVVVWGGASRLRYHGVLALKAGSHALLGEQRINLTLRKAA